jgi:hypothetical protein
MWGTGMVISTRDRRGFWPFRLLGFITTLTLLSAMFSSAAMASPSQAEGPLPVGAAPVIPATALPLYPTPASRVLDFDIVLRPRDPGRLHSLALRLSAPGAADRGHFLTVPQFADRFGQPRSVLASADATLRAVGLRPGRVTPNRLLIPVSTTIGQAEASLNTTFVTYRLATGRIAFANTSAPSLPKSVVALTAAVVGLNDLAQEVPESARPESARQAGLPSSSFHPPARFAHATRAASSGPAACSKAVKTAKADHGWTYPQIAGAYSLSGLYDQGDLGAKATIALFEQEPYKTSDIKSFQACYGTSASVTEKKFDGPGSGAGQGEAALDIETVIALAPQAKILVYQEPNNEKYTLDGYEHIINDNKAQILSTSWGLCEPETETDPGLIQSENTLFEQAAVDGISVFAAAGDAGSEDCEGNPGTGSNETLSVDDPASQPFVTAVGGTDLTAVGSPPAETVWNEGLHSKNGSGGGGISSVWPMPAWQAGAGIINQYSSGQPCGNAGGYCRETPDVSASADPVHGYIIYHAGSWSAVGGTSAAAPLWAALLAVIESKSGHAMRAGFLNPLLYSEAVGSASPFNDITVGNNDYTGTHNGKYPATAAYDLASGLGSPVATKLDLKPSPGQLTATQAPLPAGAATQQAYAYLSAVACPSLSSCVAAGYYTDSAGNGQGLLESGSGTAWTPTEAPLPADAATAPTVYLNSVACSSASACVTGGDYTDSQGGNRGLLLTGSGTSWTATEAPLPPDAGSFQLVEINAVTCPSETCTAVGSYSSAVGQPGLLLTGSGTSWTATEAPVPANSATAPNVYLYAVSCSSTTSCTAVGTYQDSSGIQQGLILTKSGTSWTATEAPLPKGATTNLLFLSTVACPTATSCTAGGWYRDASTQENQGLLLTGSGTSWTAALAPLPDPGANPNASMTAAACPSVSCTEVGQYQDVSGVHYQGLIETGSGTFWTPTQPELPSGASGDPHTQLTSLACPSASSCVTVGSYWDSSTGQRGMLLTGSGTSWTAAQAPLPDNAADNNPDTSLYAVTCPSATSCTTVGGYTDSSGNGQALLVTSPG